jgi:EAL domain-containing protein (putative c-di-GMP-specific phosphodiesterase class I)
MVSRIGGDEFVITCPRTPDLGFLGDVAADLVEKLSQPIKWGGGLISCEASIGAAISSDETAAEDLLAQADFALYEAKRGGRNHAAVYDTPMQDRHETILRRSSEFADALSTEALDCYFQPKMALDTGEIVGVEALVRWDHPTDGLVSPDDLLPIAKGLGLMAELDLQSMSFAIREKQKLVDVGFENIGVAFNASPELLVHPDFYDRLIWEVDGAGIDRAQITIEVLETTDFGDRSETSSQASTIRKLQEAGFQVHLDDFGIGFAGLSHLATLNVTGVKLDRSLVSDLSTDVTSQKIVLKIIELSKELTLSVIAEGVGDSATADMLREMGCNVIQGYWLAKPMPASALHAWLEVRRRQHTYKTA